MEKLNKLFTKFKELDRNDTIRYSLFSIITFMYIFRGMFVYFHVEKMIYFFSAILFFYCIMHIKKIKSVSKYILLYFVAIFLSIIFSLINNLSGFFISIAGFLSSYFNFLLCFLFLSTIEKEDLPVFLSKYLKMILWFGVVSALLGVFQTFVDPSIFGFANNDIYGNPELLATGGYTIRATALLGSAQNYGLFIGIAFALSVFEKDENKFIYYLRIIILLIGVLISGSRSASIAVIISFLVLSFKMIKDRKNMGKFSLKEVKKGKILIICFLIILLIIGGVFIVSKYFNSTTIKRLLNFDISSALNVYKTTLEKLSIKEVILGYGLGYRDWAVKQLVGENCYEMAFHENYTSAESFFMLSFIQSGIFKLIATVVLSVASIVRSLKNHDYELFAILLCLFINQVHTPSFSGMAMSFVFYPILLYYLIYGNVCRKESVEDE